MELQEFIEKLFEIFEVTDRSELTPEANFKELEEWDSLMALELIALVDEEFDRELDGNDISNSETIEELFNLIMKKADNG